MRRNCKTCGVAFEAKGDYQKRCLSCWRKSHDQEIEDRGYIRGYQKGYADGRRATRVDITDELLWEAIQLCHPDRHPEQRQTMANRVTARLNVLRSRLRG